MNNFIKIAAAFTLVGLCTACTSSAGPFVTNVSSDGHGNLIVEKCMVELQRQISTVQNSNCTTTPIALGLGQPSGPAARLYTPSQ